MASDSALLAELAARESRLEARLIVLGFESVEELDEFIYRNGSAQVIPNLQNQETQETQFSLTPQQKLERYQAVKSNMKSMKELVKMKDKELEYSKKLLKAEKEKSGDRLKDLELLRSQFDRPRSSDSSTQSSELKKELDETTIQLQISYDENALLSVELQDSRKENALLTASLEKERLDWKELELNLKQKLSEETKRRKATAIELNQLNTSLATLVNGRASTATTAFASSPEDIAAPFKIFEDSAVDVSNSSKMFPLPALAGSAASAALIPSDSAVTTLAAPLAVDLLAPNSSAQAGTSTAVASSSPVVPIVPIPMRSKPTVMPSNLSSFPRPQPTPSTTTARLPPIDSGFASTSRIESLSTSKWIEQRALTFHDTPTLDAPLVSKVVKPKSSAPRSKPSQKAELLQRAQQMQLYPALVNNIKLKMKKCLDIQESEPKLQEWFHAVQESFDSPPMILSDELRQIRLPRLEELIDPKKPNELLENYRRGESALKKIEQTYDSLVTWRAEGIRRLGLIRTDKTPVGIIRKKHGSIESPPGSTPSLPPRKSSALIRSSQLVQPSNSPHSKNSPRPSGTSLLPVKLPVNPPSTRRCSPIKQSTQPLSPRKAPIMTPRHSASSLSSQDERLFQDTPQKTKKFDLFPGSTASGVSKKNPIAPPRSQKIIPLCFPLFRPQAEVEVELEMEEPDTVEDEDLYLAGKDVRLIDTSSPGQEFRLLNQQEDLSDQVEPFEGRESLRSPGKVGRKDFGEAERSSLLLEKEKEKEGFMISSIKREVNSSPREKKRVRNDENCKPRDMSTSSFNELHNGFLSDEEIRPKKKGKKLKKNESREELEEELEGEVKEEDNGGVEHREMIRTIRANRRAENERIAAEKVRNSKVPIQRVIELNPDRNQGETFHYHESVRDKAGRAGMYGGACDDCEAYHRKAYGLPAPPCKDHVAAATNYLDDRHRAMEAQLQKTSRHRAQQKPQPDPAFYWEMGWPNTQQQEHIHDQAVENRRNTRAYQESEAAKPNGLYRYKAD